MPQHMQYALNLSNPQTDETGNVIMEASGPSYEVVRIAESGEVLDTRPENEPWWWTPDALDHYAQAHEMTALYVTKCKHCGQFTVLPEGYIA